MSENDNKTNFIKEIINKDLENNKNNGQVITRFPPEPNGYLHIGHAKSICLNFGIAEDYENARCHLRFDDTNPITEDIDYIHSIMDNIKWLGYDWGEHLYYASDYFEKFYDYAVVLIKKEKAYVCNLNEQEMKEYRGSLTEPGKNSPYRNRSVDENLELFEKMKNGEFENGECVLRAKIDMSSPNMNMRDPIIYRIKKAEHHRTGNKWCIYPMYDFAHCLEDSIEGITHSLCTLEFEDHRPLYDWFLDQLDVECHPQQIEFARLNLNYTVMSKRKLLGLVEKKYVTGWDDPRLPTISGLRRRGFTPQSIRTFCDKIGIAKSKSVVDYALLEHCLRDELNVNAQRRMAVLNPVKLVITNYPEDKVEELDASNHPQNKDAGTRKIKFTRNIYIDKDDFMEDPPKKFFRLAPGREVRLFNAYYVKCKNVVKDNNGNIIEIQCTYDPETKGGWSPHRKVKGSLHWVSADYCADAEIRLYNHLFLKENPDADKNFYEHLNPDSLEIIKNCKVELSLTESETTDRFQFLRKGYFCIDNKDSKKDELVFNRIVPLKDSWKKIMNS